MTTNNTKTKTSPKTRAKPSRDNTTPLTDRTLTELDHVRLEKLLQRQDQASPQSLLALEDVLGLAQIVPSRDIAPQVATLNSRISVQFADDAQPREITLRYPHEADASNGDISVLSPLGTAVLGLHEGHAAQWQQIDGQIKRLQLLKVLFQPEANGEFTR